MASICANGLNAGKNGTKCYENPSICSGICPKASYIQDNTLNWGPPGDSTNVPLDPNNGICQGGVRNANNYCAIQPRISNIEVNKQNINIILTTSQFVNLTFNSMVDSQQLPMVMYAVDWGDNSKTTVTGVEMRDRPDPDPADPNNDGNPHSLYHLYSYWDLKAKASSGVAGIDCSTAGECRVRPKVQIKDNWGWCNKGTAINVCGAGQWDNFGGLVVVKEK